MTSYLGTNSSGKRRGIASRCEQALVYRTADRESATHAGNSHRSKESDITYRTVTTTLLAKIADTESRSLAMLIDGDNAQPSLIEHVMTEAAKYGTVTIRRIYGNWTTQQMSSWKECLHSHAIKPMQQFNYTTGKNATDGALIIDAMDILHSGAVHGFCIVSSDSDYTGLAIRIREKGMLAIGIGKSITPASFRNACNVFIYTENLSPQADPGALVPKIAPPSWKEAVKRAVEMSAQEDDWVLLSEVGTNLQRVDPAFDSRTYGHKKLLPLIESDPEKFETRQHRTDDKPPVCYVKLRPQQ